MWPTWGGIRKSSLKAQQSSDTWYFNLTEQKIVRQGKGKIVTRQTRKHKSVEDEVRRGKGGETIKMLMT